jgi:hypothetical protein
MLVSADELIKYMSNLNLNVPQKEEAQEILNGVQGELETYCNRPLELVQIRELVTTDGQGFANVSISPIHKVISHTAVEAGLIAPFTGYYTPIFPAPMERDILIGEEGRMIDNVRTGGNAVGDPLIVPGGFYAGYAMSPYIIEYIGGYNLATMPQYESVRTAIKRVAAREVGPMYDDTIDLRSGDAVKNREPDNRGKGWTEDELKRFDRLRRRVVV